MSEINSSNFKKEHGDLAPDLVGVTELTSPYFFVPPSGNTAERPEDCEPGTLRFNTDHGSLEVFRGKNIGWEQIQKRDSQYLGGDVVSVAGSDISNYGTGHRALFNGSTSPYGIQLVTISTFGDAQDFSDLNQNVYWCAGSASSTRGLINGGYNAVDTIQFVTIASQGTNAQDFGNLTTGRHQLGALSSQTRSIALGGASSDVLDYVTIAHTGNAVDFGDLSGNCLYPFMASSTTRGIIAGGGTPSIKNIIEFVTITTTGNVSDFGDLPNPRFEMGSQSTSATRAVFGGGKTPTTVNTMEFITMATTGNAIDFGDLTRTTYQVASGVASSPTRGLALGGYPSPSQTIDAIEIATTGNSVDFGDAVRSSGSGFALSNGHGGL